MSEVPKELWPTPTFFDKNNYLKAHSALIKGGLKAIGYDKKKLFRYILDLIEQRDVIEDIYIEAVFQLDKIAKGKKYLAHFSEKDNIVTIFKKDSSYYRNYSSDFATKMKDRKVPLYTINTVDINYERVYSTKAGQSWLKVRDEIDDANVYPEAEEYKRCLKIFCDVQSKINSIARVIDDLFGLPDNFARHKPCKISFPGFDKSIFLSACVGNNIRDIYAGHLGYDKLEISE